MNWMGIDGGGSSLRVVIVDDALNILAAHNGPAVNPGGVGRDEAARRIQAGVRDVLRALPDADVQAVGLGIAGAAADHSRAWLHMLLRPVLPEAAIIASSDEEVALVGARGVREGLVVLAGTGSVAYGINATGASLRAGGWGYLLGDEGSGYWLGSQALRAITLAADGRLHGHSDLPAAVMGRIGINNPRDVIEWTYHQAQPAQVAALADLVLGSAAAGDGHALEIIDQGAGHLVEQAQHVQANLGLPRDAVAFAGGLLTTSNALSERVAARLGLAAPPASLYPPAVGAALLAALMHRGS